ncbi:hypothetical protein B0H13DRAFT_2300218 [Mycena leptocephala]|nr:hypothetical protein B0H13DRAFT_2300218 [Mycena leptocephala]
MHFFLKRLDATLLRHDNALICPPVNLLNNKLTAQTSNVTVDNCSYETDTTLCNIAGDCKIQSVVCSYTVIRYRCRSPFFGLPELYADAVSKDSGGASTASLDQSCPLAIGDPASAERCPHVNMAQAPLQSGTSNGGTTDCLYLNEQDVSSIHRFVLFLCPTCPPARASGAARCPYFNEANTLLNNGASFGNTTECLYQNEEFPCENLASGPSDCPPSRVPGPPPPPPPPLPPGACPDQDKDQEFLTGGSTEGDFFTCVYFNAPDACTYASKDTGEFVNGPTSCPSSAQGSSPPSANIAIGSGVGSSRLIDNGNDSGSGSNTRPMLIAPLVINCGLALVILCTAGIAIFGKLSKRSQ